MESGRLTQKLDHNIKLRVPELKTSEIHPKDLEGFAKHPKALLIPSGRKNWSGSANKREGAEGVRSRHESSRPHPRGMERGSARGGSTGRPKSKSGRGLSPARGSWGEGMTVCAATPERNGGIASQKGWGGLCLRVHLDHRVPYVNGTTGQDLHTLT